MRYLFFILILTGCSNGLINHGWVNYKVKAGEHSCNHSPILYNQDSLSFSYIIDSSWFQEASEPGVNKICGFTSGLIHENSARLGWQYFNDSIWIYLYVYNDGKSPSEKEGTKRILKSVNIGTHNASIIKRKDRYIFISDGERYECQASGNLPGAICFPYIGGNGVFKKDWVCKLIIHH